MPIRFLLTIVLPEEFTYYKRFILAWTRPGLFFNILLEITKPYCGASLSSSQRQPESPEWLRWSSNQIALSGMLLFNICLDLALFKNVYLYRFSVNTLVANRQTRKLRRRRGAILLRLQCLRVVINHSIFVGNQSH